MLFDTHCHLDDERFDADREAILDDMAARGFMPCVVVGADMPSSRRCRALAHTRSWLYFAAAVHPHDAKAYSDGAHAELTALMADARCVAWGEIGLDYYYDLSTCPVQGNISTGCALCSFQPQAESRPTSRARVAGLQLT